MTLFEVALFVFLLNLPFGYLRAKSEKFSRNWFVFVHAPIPFIIALRLLSGLGFALYTFPIMVSAYFAGQFAGGLALKLKLVKSK
ncbi:hypothetical protein [Hippea alviniae]|uniref:hypothetical protein n=1 Tax=Hippea alviniae TaxID=1279027 RepID=UPI0003B3D4CC|nr:hypothetical protein [Hippea alviniae]